MSAIKRTDLLRAGYKGTSRALLHATKTFLSRRDGPESVLSGSWTFPLQA